MNFAIFVSHPSSDLNILSLQVNSCLVSERDASFRFSAIQYGQLQILR